MAEVVSTLQHQRRGINVAMVFAPFDLESDADQVTVDRLHARLKIAIVATFTCPAINDVIIGNELDHRTSMSTKSTGEPGPTQ